MKQSQKKTLIDNKIMIINIFVIYKISNENFAFNNGNSQYLAKLTNCNKENIVTIRKHDKSFIYIGMT